MEDFGMANDPLTRKIRPRNHPGFTLTTVPSREDPVISDIRFRRFHLISATAANWGSNPLFHIPDDTGRLIS